MVVRVECHGCLSRWGQSSPLSFGSSTSFPEVRLCCTRVKGGSNMLDWVSETAGTALKVVDVWSIAKRVSLGDGSSFSIWPASPVRPEIYGFPGLASLFFNYLGYFLSWVVFFFTGYSPAPFWYWPSGLTVCVLAFIYWCRWGGCVAVSSPADSGMVRIDITNNVPPPVTRQLAFQNTFGPSDSVTIAALKSEVENLQQELKLLKRTANARGRYLQYLGRYDYQGGVDANTKLHLCASDAKLGISSGRIPSAIENMALTWDDEAGLGKGPVRQWAPPEAGAGARKEACLIEMMSLEPRALRGGVLHPVSLGGVMLGRFMLRVVSYFVLPP